jgi:hypothetical protein
MFFEAIVGTKIEVVLRIFLVERGRTEQVVQVVWHIFRGVVFLGGSYNSTDLAHFLGRFLEGLLGVVSGFLLL